MQPPDLQLLRLSLDTLDSGARVAFLDLDHGRANEMGSAALRDWEALCAFLEAGGARALVTSSRRRSRKGTPIFIAGADVTERVGWTPDQVKGHVRWQRAVLQRLRRVPVLHVGVVSGVALGWGTEFLLCCDVRIACPGATFGLPETGLGIVPGAGGTSELWSLVGVNQALRLGLTGERIGPDEAARIGLVEEVAESLEAGLERARALAARAAKNSPTALAAFKRGVLASVGQSGAVRTEVEATAYERCVDSGEAAVGRARFGQARKGEDLSDWGPLDLGVDR